MSDVTQCREALTRANTIKQGRYALRRQVQRGERSLALLLQDPPPVIAGMTIWALAKWLPRVGEQTAWDLLGGTSPAVTVGDADRVTRLRVAYRICDLEARRGRQAADLQKAV